MIQKVVLSMLVVIAILTLPGYAETPTSEPKPSQSNPLAPKKLALFLDFNYGFSYATQMVADGGFLVGPDENSAELLDEIDLELSTNLLALQFTATYAINPRLVLHGSIPFGFVVPRDENRLPGIFNEDDIEFEVGDVYGGIYWQALLETHHRPSLYVSLYLDSGVSHFTSLGDGFSGSLLGIRAKKTLGDKIYLTGVGNYTYRFEKNGITPGDVIQYGLGLGFWWKQGVSEIELIKSDIGAYKRGERTLLEQDSELSLELGGTPFPNSPRRLLRWSIKVYFANFEDGFDFKQNTFGFIMSFPLTKR